MNSNELVKEYHYCHDKEQDFTTFSDNCENYYTLGLKLYILKEKLLDFMRIRFEEFIKICKRDNIPVIRALKGRMRTNSHNLTKKPVSFSCVDGFINNSGISSWDCNWWIYARLFAKNEYNSVEEEPNNSDPLNVLRIFTSCILFTDATSIRSCEVLRIHNTFAHLPSLQVSNVMLNKYLYTVGLLERDGTR